MNKQELQILLGQETKYSKWYLDIIFNAKNKNRKRLKKGHLDYVYFEAHHILPRSIFPEYKDFKLYEWNKVLLTAKEHYICHALIWKHYKKLDKKPHIYKMAFAFRRMQNGGSKGQQRYTSRLYERCKIVFKYSKDSIRKQKETMQEKVFYDDRWMTKQDMTTIKSAKTQQWKNRRFDIYHIEKGLVQKDMSARDIRELSPGLFNTSKEKYLGKRNNSKITSLQKRGKDHLIGFYIIEKPSFKDRGYTKPK